MNEFEEEIDSDEDIFDDIACYKKESNRKDHSFNNSAYIDLIDDDNLQDDDIVKRKFEKIYPNKTKYQIAMKLHQWRGNISKEYGFKFFFFFLHFFFFYFFYTFF